MDKDAKQFLNSIVKEDVQDFILSHEYEDVHKLLLKQVTVLGLPTEWVAQQIIGRRKVKLKLPAWYNTRNIVYPRTINLEQSSSEATAQFKFSILKKEAHGPNGADLTGGFGVDTYFLSKLALHVDYVEPNEELLEIARHNHRLLGATNITYHCISAIDFLSQTEQFDFIFLDPSRRKASRKVYKLAECEPDVAGLQSHFFGRAKRVLIKTSPLLDLRQGLRELQYVAKVIVVAVENECKELLFLQERGFDGGPSVTAVDLDKSGETLNSVSFTLEDEKNSVAEFSAPLTYLFEPNAAILKAGAFKWIAEKFHLKKLGTSTHLYTADRIIDFPGRIFRITESAKVDKRLKDRFANGYANIITRNYPMSVEEIKKKTGLKEGGELFLICGQVEVGKFSVVAERIK